MTTAQVIAGGGWGPALAAIERQLDAVERILAEDSWDAVPELAVYRPEGPLPAALEPVARQLFDRIAALERRLRAEQAETGSALRELTLRRQAGRNYSGSERKPLGNPVADD